LIFAGGTIINKAKHVFFARPLEQAGFFLHDDLLQEEKWRTIQRKNWVQR